MLTAIVNLNSKTTTELDRQAVKSPEKIIGFSPEDRTKYFLAMEEEFASYSGMNEQEIITSDYKEYEKSGVKFGKSKNGGKFITVPEISHKKLIGPIENTIQDWLNSQFQEAA